MEHLRKELLNNSTCEKRKEVVEKIVDTMEKLREETKLQAGVIIK